MVGLTKAQTLKFLAFSLAFWLAGALLAMVFGLGWFFLLGGVRRLLLTLPQTRLTLTRIIFGEERAEWTREQLHQAGVRRRRLSTGLEGIATIGWLVLAVIVFAKFNFRVVDLFP